MSIENSSQYIKPFSRAHFFDVSLMRARSYGKCRATDEAAWKEMKTVSFGHTARENSARSSGTVRVWSTVGRLAPISQFVVVDKMTIVAK